MAAVKTIGLSASLLLLGIITGFSTALAPPTVTAAFIAAPILVMLALMPELRTVPIVAARISLYTFVFCIMSVPDYYTLILPGLPWISIRRLVLFTCIISTLLTLAGSHEHRQNVARKLRASPIITISFLCYWIISLLSALQSVDPVSTLAGFVNANILTYIPFVAAILVLNSVDDILRLMKLMIICVFIDVTLGGIEFTLHRPFLIQALPPNMRDLVVASAPAYEALVQSNSYRNGFYRAVSVYITALSWGEMAAMMAPVALYFMIYCRTMSSRVFGLLGAIACVMSIVFSGSRGAYVTLLLGTCSYFLMWALRQLRENPKSLSGPFLLILFSMGTAAAALAVLFVGRLHNLVLGGGAAQLSTMGRTLQWAIAWPKIFSRPILGYGPGTAAGIVGWAPPGGFVTLDSYFINLLVSTGFLGFAAFMAFFLSSMAISFLTYCTSKHKNTAALNSLACSLLAFCVYRYTLNQVENLTLAHILAACCIVASYAKSKTDDQGKITAERDTDFRRQQGYNVRHHVDAHVY